MEERVQLPLQLRVISPASPIPKSGRGTRAFHVGNNKTWLEHADKVILEVNYRQPAELDGMHDIYYGTALPPNRVP
jgi:succinyl-CoA:acetate CoA-transferase